MIFLLIARYLVGIIAVAGIFFFSQHSLAIVNGNSMLPTYRPGKIIVLRRKPYSGKRRHSLIANREKTYGRIAIFKDPEGSKKLIVKRIKYVSIGTDGIFFWVLGDNPSESRDSRDFGFIAEQFLVGEVVESWKQMIKSIFSRRL